MQSPWSIIGAGIFFCISGVYLFSRNAFEENRSIRWPVLLIIMGVVLIGVGTAKNMKYF